MLTASFNCYQFIWTDHGIAYDRESIILFGNELALL